MSAKYKNHNNDKYHYSAKYHTEDPIYAYKHSFLSTLYNKSIESRAILDIDGNIVIDSGHFSKVCSGLGSASSSIPVIGTFLNVLGSVSGFISSAYHKHKILVKAQNFVDFVGDKTEDFENFAQDLVNDVIKHHGKYISTLSKHPESIKNFPIDIVDKLNAKSDHRHTETEKLASMLGKYHAKFIIDVVKKGLDHGYTDVDEMNFKNDINSSFLDEKQIPANIIGAVFLSDIDDSSSEA